MVAYERGRDPDFAASVVHLGALGVVSRLTTVLTFPTPILAGVTGFALPGGRIATIIRVPALCAPHLKIEIGLPSPYVLHRDLREASASA